MTKPTSEEMASAIIEYTAATEAHAHFVARDIPIAEGMAEAHRCSERADASRRALHELGVRLRDASAPGPGTAPNVALVVDVAFEIDVDLIASTIISGYEFGIYYWARDVDGIIPDEIAAALTDGQREWMREHGRIAFAAMTPGCHVELIEHGDEGLTDLRRFDVDDVKRAIASMSREAPRRFGILRDGGDSDSGDVLFQYAALREEKYS